MRAEEKAHIRSALVLVFSSARRERGVVYLGGDGDPEAFDRLDKKSLPLLDAFGGALVLSTRPKRGAKISPRVKSSPSSSREATVRAKKAISFHLVPRRRVFPAGFSVDRPRARPWDASTIAFFGLINPRFSCTRAITRPPDQSHFSLTSLDERKRDRHREKRPGGGGGETTYKERERDDSSYSSYFFTHRKRAQQRYV